MLFPPIKPPNQTKPNQTNPTKQGYSIGSAALACFLLFGAFLDEFSQFSGKPFRVVDIAVPEVLIGGLIGTMMIYWFCGLAIAAVGTTASKVVIEVRRQFRCVQHPHTPNRRIDDQPTYLSRPRLLISSIHHPQQSSDNPDIMTFKSRPDYRTCVAIVTAAALQEMVLPGLLATGLPIVVGLVFRGVGSLTGRPMLGAEALAGYLRCVCGVIRVVVWDRM